MWLATDARRSDVNRALSAAGEESQLSLRKNGSKAIKPLQLV